jgi:nitric oxide reductase NorQ protein
MTGASPREAAIEIPRVESVPWYRPVSNECEIFEHAYQQKLPLLLKGPTGCGKTRLVEHMAARLGRSLISVACHDETSAVDLVGRYLIGGGGETFWQDGPVSRAVREGAILYLDEFAEARSDVVVVIHPLSDHRRELYIERTDEKIAAAEGFMLVASYNPGYQHGLKDLKPSTKQRFLSLPFDYPTREIEVEIIRGVCGIGEDTAKRLAALAARLRSLETVALAESPSTRLLVNAARLIQAGFPPRAACHTAIVEALTDDREIAAGLRDVVALAF